LHCSRSSLGYNYNRDWASRIAMGTPFLTSIPFAFPIRRLWNGCPASEVRRSSPFPPLNRKRLCPSAGCSGMRLAGGALWPTRPIRFACAPAP
jgi:hypothetical protein